MNSHGALFVENHLSARRKGIEVGTVDFFTGIEFKVPVLVCGPFVVYLLITRTTMCQNPFKLLPDAM